MTGFAVGDAPLCGGRLTLEVRSLNHRFLELRLRLPPELADHAFYVEQLARERLTRGRYDLGVRVDGSPPAPQIDRARLRAAYVALCEVRDELAPNTDVPVAALAAMPSLFREGGAPHVDACREALQAALLVALGALDEMRGREGSALTAELRRRLTTARSLRAAIEARGPELAQAGRARLAERIERLLRDVAVPLDTNRLENELALLADRADVTEELVRLGIHFDQFERLLDAAEPVGRRLDFLLQEISREANTLGAKSQDAPLAHLVVELKAEIERLREQVQNVE